MVWKESYTFDWWAVGSLKLAMIFFTFIVLKIWGGLATWVDGVNVWWFVLVFILLCIKPLKDCCDKKRVRAVEKVEKKVARKVKRKRK